jgi:hypothetical protein
MALSREHRKKLSDAAKKNWQLRHTDATFSQGTAREVPFADYWKTKMSQWGKTHTKEAK